MNISLEKLKNIKLMVGTPMYGSKCHGAYLSSIISLLKLCNRIGVRVGVSSICNESLLQRSRNYVVDEFLRSGFTHLMFVDTDIQFQPEHVVALLMADKDIVGAPYPEKIDVDWKKIIQSIKDGTANEETLPRITGEFVFDTQRDPTDVVEVESMKPGFMMIKRRVFERLQTVYPENYYKPDHIGITHFDGARHIQMFFSVEIDPETRKLLSEYDFFCKLWRKIGGKIYMCPWMVVSHIGNHLY